MAGRTDLEQLLFVVSNDVTKVLKNNEKMLASINGTVTKGNKKFNELGRVDTGGALKSIFDSSRLKVLDTGIARVGLFGGALEKLGPVGLAGAAGIGALAFAIGQARSAMDFADEIGDSAAKLQTTTDFLQEMRYAIHAAGGEFKDADTAIGSFQETLGKAQAGAAKSLKWFQALGFTKAQVDSFHSTDDAMRAVMERIAALPSASQRAGAAAALGLSAMIPVINLGKDGLDGLIQKAHDAGVVMDKDLIQKLGDAKDEVENASIAIKVQLATAFANLSPIIAGATHQLAAFIKLFNDHYADIVNFSIKIAHVVPGLAPAATLMDGGAFLLAGKGNATPAKAPVPKTTPVRGSGTFDLGGGSKSKSKSDDNPITEKDTVAAVLQAQQIMDRIQAEADAANEKRMSQYADLVDRSAKKTTALNDAMQQADRDAMADQLAWLDKLEEEELKLAEEGRKQLHDSTYEGIRGGLQAIADGDLFEYVGNKFKQSLLDGLAEDLTQAVLKSKALSGIGAGGGGNWVDTAISFGKHLFGFAGGTNSAPGGWAEINEQGPEGVAYLPKGAQVIPNSVMRGLANMSVAPRGGVTVLQPLHFHAEGAVLTQDILNQVNALSRAHATAAGLAVYQAATHAIPAQMIAQAGRRLGR